jgi:predicted N-formylglutamate amidohydrolase
MMDPMLERDQSATSPPAPAETSAASASSADDPPVVEVANPGGRAPVLLLCDHAGRRIPAWLEGLGLPAQELERHIAFDIGAAEVTRGLARLLDAPAVLCHASRLVIDPNRLPGDPASIPAVSDGTVVPGNQELGPEEVRRRRAYGFVPYHRTVARQIARLRRRHGVPALVSLHSFSPSLGGVARPWAIAVLWDEDTRLAAPVLAGLRRDRSLAVGANEPYSGRFPIGYSIPFHAARSGLPHVTFELRQDLIARAEDAALWAARLAGVLREPLSDRKLYRHHPAERTPACRSPHRP